MITGSAEVADGSFTLNHSWRAESRQWIIFIGSAPV
jgi:hypothetical protein